MSARPRADNPPRTGSVLVIVLVGLFVASLLGLALLETLLIHQRQMRASGTEQQGLWLAEAGLQRAVRGLQASPAYQGETWSVPAEVLGPSHSAEVKIEVVEPHAAPDEREIRVQSRLGNGSEYPGVYRRTHRIRLSAQASVEEEREGEHQF